MIKIFIFNILCIIAIIALVIIGGHDTNSNYAVGGLFLTMFADIIGNLALGYQTDMNNITHKQYK